MMISELAENCDLACPGLLQTRQVAILNDLKWVWGFSKFESAENNDSPYCISMISKVSKITIHADIHEESFNQALKFQAPLGNDNHYLKLECCSSIWNERLQFSLQDFWIFEVPWSSFRNLNSNLVPQMRLLVWYMSVLIPSQSKSYWIRIVESMEILVSRRVIRRSEVTCMI